MEDLKKTIKRRINEYQYARELTEKATKWDDSHIIVGTDTYNAQGLTISFLQKAQEKFVEEHKEEIKAEALKMIDAEIASFKAWIKEEMEEN